MNKPASDQPAPAGNFIALLQGVTGGVALHQLDHELAALVQKVQEAGRAGTLTYKVKVLPNAKQGVRVETAVDVKEPKLETGVSFFWVGQGGALLKNDPNQTELALRVLPDERPNLKTATN